MSVANIVTNRIWDTIDGESIDESDWLISEDIFRKTLRKTDKNC